MNQVLTTEVIDEIEDVTAKKADAELKRRGRVSRGWKRSANKTRLSQQRFKPTEQKAHLSWATTLFFMSKEGSGQSS